MSSVPHINNLFRVDQARVIGIDPLDSVSHGWDELRDENSLKRTHTPNNRKSREMCDEMDPSKVGMSTGLTTGLMSKLGFISKPGNSSLDTVVHGIPEELEGLRFIIPNKMAFLAVSPDRLSALKKTLQSLKMTCVSSDLHKQYTAFCSDFGPVNLSIVYRFCRAMSTKLNKLNESNSVLLYCIEPAFEHIANASFLLAAFLLLQCGCSPAQAAAPFTGPDAPFDVRPFRDATFTPQNFDLTIQDCLEGLAQAVSLGWFDVRTFDLDAYQRLDSPDAGDVHQVRAAPPPAHPSHPGNPGPSPRPPVRGGWSSAEGGGGEAAG